MFEPSVFHDTYYVVAHGEYLFSLLGLFLAGWALWALAQRWSDSNLIRSRRLTLLAFLLGCALALSPVLLVNLIADRDISAAVTYFHWANRSAVLGTLLIVVAGLATLFMFIRAGIQRLRP